MTTLLPASLAALCLSAAMPPAADKPIDPPAAKPSAPEPARDEAGKELVAVRLQADRAAVAPGSTVTALLTLDIAPGWHTYWPGQNDTGMPTSVTWAVPEGVTVGELREPAPRRYELPGDLLDYVHEGRATSVVTLKVGRGFKPGDKLKLRALVSYLVCKEACIPGEAEVTLELPVVEPVPAPGGEGAQLLAQAQARLPLLSGWSDAAGVQWRLPGKPGEPIGVTFAAKSKGVTRMAFLPHTDGLVLTDPLKTGQRDGAELALAFAPATGGRARPVKGILQLTTAAGVASYAVDVAPPAK
jgi:DsbC/DsbD-like thiol-disulfide interchange protein